MRGGEPTFLGSMAGVCWQVRRRSGPGTWLRLARLAATYVLILAIVAPPLIGTAGPAAHRSQKPGGRQRANNRPSAVAKVSVPPAAYRCRSPEHGTAVASGPHRTHLSPPVLTPALSGNPSALNRVFRPLRC